MFFGAISAASKNASEKKNVTLAKYQQEAIQNLAQLEVCPTVDAMEDDEDGARDDFDYRSDPRLDRLRRATQTTWSRVKTPSTVESLNDEDAKCYASRYNDIDAMLDPKTHYATTGIA